MDSTPDDSGSGSEVRTPRARAAPPTSSPGTGHDGDAWVPTIPMPLPSAEAPAPAAPELHIPRFLRLKR